MTEHELFENSSAKDAFLQKFLWQPENVGLDVPLSVADTAANATYYYFADANKNIGQVADSSGQIVAKYEYSPFGKIVSQSGSYAATNPFKFSSEYYDTEIATPSNDRGGLVYYNYRYYSPALGRWLSRDPIEEDGGWNLYGMINNNPVNSWDKLGLFECCGCEKYDSQKACCVNESIIPAQSKAACDYARGKLQALSRMLQTINNQLKSLSKPE